MGMFLTLDLVIADNGSISLSITSAAEYLVSTSAVFDGTNERGEPCKMERMSRAEDDQHERTVLWVISPHDAQCQS